MEIKNVANIQTTLKMTEAQTSGRTENLGISRNVQNKKTEEKRKLSPQELEKIAKDLKEKLSMLNTQLKIEMEKVGDNEEIPIIKVIDTNTKEVIRQIPPEYMVKIAKYIDEITGLLVREKA